MLWSLLLPTNISQIIFFCRRDPTLSLQSLTQVYFSLFAPESLSGHWQDRIQLVDQHPLLLLLISQKHHFRFHLCKKKISVLVHTTADNHGSNSSFHDVWTTNKQKFLHSKSLQSTIAKNPVKTQHLELKQFSFAWVSWVFQLSYSPGRKASLLTWLLLTRSPTNHAQWLFHFNFSRYTPEEFNNWLASARIVSPTEKRILLRSG